MGVYLASPEGVFRQLAVKPEIVRDATGLIEIRVRAGILLGNDYGEHLVRLVILPEGSELPGTAGKDYHPDGGQVFDRSLVYEVHK